MAIESGTIEPGELGQQVGATIFDCRFSLADSNEGNELYLQGHIPGAHYLNLETDLSAPVSRHGGRHPLPDPDKFASLLAKFGVGPETDVIAYDDSRFAYASRLWWMMKAIGFKPPVLLNGGYQAWLVTGATPETDVPRPVALTHPETGLAYRGRCDIEAVRTAQTSGTTIVDSRESPRFLGLEEPIDPIAGCIPGAVNRPWQGVSNEAGEFLDNSAQKQHWGELLSEKPLIVYCGSGVTACVNLFSLHSLGRDDAILYSGSWSDWCSYL